MRKYLITVLILVLMLGCKSKKSSDTENKGNNAAKADKGTESKSFSNAFNTLKLPFSVTDTDMAALAMTDTISYSLYSQLISDTIFVSPFGKNRKLSVYPVGKVEPKGKETYFVIFVKDKSRSAMYLFVYDRQRMMAAMPLVINGENNTVNSATIDKKLSININKEWTVKNDIFYKRTIYAYNNAGVFTTVLTETNEDRSAESGVLNPLDTFPKKYKYSGDYTKGKKNVLFIRDGKIPSQYLFFVHFESESNGESCGGELKGSLKMVSDKAGVYTGNGDPCVLNLSFTDNEVKVKETGSCGNYRGIKCFFSDTYIKKKEPKSVGKKK